MVYSYNDILTFELVATVVLKDQATRRKKGKYDQEEVTNHFAENDKIRRNKEIKEPIMSANYVTDLLGEDQEVNIQNETQMRDSIAYQATKDPRY
ncbi:8136_t:CDS:2 [Rhizophagus irregularis]|nr:8136_t:CDS:2 [Rhizophagus irregularis]